MAASLLGRIVNPPSAYRRQAASTRIRRGPASRAMSNGTPPIEPPRIGLASGKRRAPAVAPQRLSSMAPAGLAMIAASASAPAIGDAGHRIIDGRRTDRRQSMQQARASL